MQRQAETTVPGAAAGLRLDHWLARRFTYHSRSRWQSEIAQGRVRLNGRPGRQAAVPRTGRRHQIRASLLGLGFPVVGDKLYGGDETRYLRYRDGCLTAADREALGMPRQALHGWQLELRHPLTAQPLQLTAPLPPDFRAALAREGFVEPQPENGRRRAT